MEAANHPNCNRQPVGEEIFIFDPLAYPQNVGAQENHDKDSLMSRQGGLSSHGIQPCLCILGGSEGRRDGSLCLKSQGKPVALIGQALA